MIQIRNAQPNDASILAAAEKAIAAIPGFLVSKPEEIHSQNFHKRIAELNSIPNGKYIVAEQNGDLVGHAMLDPMGLKAIEHVVRLTIAVHPGYEEKGIGEQLLTHLIDWAKSNPAVKKIELNVRSCNTRAIRLYQKLGFNIEGRIRNRVRISDNEFVDDLEMGLFVKDNVTLPTVIGKGNLQMYNPPKFKSTDINEAFDFMFKNPFATVISIEDGKPFVSHLPLTPQKANDQIELIGHLARANPHWKILNQSPTTVIFHGPHTYITPKWYSKNDVPTWNYIAIHAIGKIELIESYEGLVKILKFQTDHVEQHWPSGWDFYIPEDLNEENLSKHIVGFKIKAEEIHFKKKLSQNRTPEDRAGVLQGLATRSDDNSREIIFEMQKLEK